MSAAPTIAPPAPESLKTPTGPSATVSSSTSAGPSKRPSRAGTSSANRSTGGSTSTAGGPRVEPSFRGILDSTYDALLLFEGSRRGLIPRIKKRLSEEQRDELIQSGSIFIFEEEESNIKRWTDGLIWSPSRILGNYLVYRQTEQRNSRAPRSGSNSKGGARKKAVKEPLTPPSPTSEDRKRSAISDAPPIKKEPLVRPPAPIGRNSFSSTPAGLDPASLLGLSAPPGSDGTGSNGLQQYFPIRPTRRRKTTGLGDDDNLMEESEEDDTRDLEELIRIKERSLVGSLTNSYAFKEGGLVKRTMSMLIDGKTQHLVSYYTLADGMTDQLRTPSTMPEFANMEIDPDLLAKAQFRFPPVVEMGLDGVLRYISEADNTLSPDPASPAALPKDVAPPVPPSPHPYYGHPSGLLSSSYPTTGLAGPSLMEPTYNSSLHFPAYSMEPAGGGSMIGYGPSSHSTYSAPDAAPHQWSSSLPKEFHHPAALASPFPHYPPLPPPPAPQQRPSAGHRRDSNSTTAKAGGPGPQRRRRASQTSTTASTAVPEGRQLVLTGSPFGQPNRPLAGGKPGFHPYAMPSPTEGWTAYHPSSARSPQHTGSSTRSSYFDGEPSVFAAGPLSSAVASTPSSAGSSISAGSGGGATLQQQQQQQHASSTLTPAMHTTALGPPGGSAGKRLSLSLGREKNFNAPHRRRSPSMQPSPLRSSAPLPLYGGEVDPYHRSGFPQHMTPYGAPTDFTTMAPHDLQGGGPDAAFSTSWMTAPHDPHAAAALHQPYTEFYDAPPEASPGHPLRSHYGPRPSPPQPSAPSFYSASSLLLNPPMTTFAEDKRSATLALDQLHFGSVGGGADDPTTAGGGREYQIPSGMVAADDRRNSFGDYSLQPLPHSPQHIEQPGPRYWAA